MMRGERWLFLSRLQWVIAVFVTAVVIVGIVLQLSGADISVGRWTPSDASQLYSARGYSMGTALGIIGIALGVISLGLGFYWRWKSKKEIDLLHGETIAARVSLTDRLEQGVPIKLEEESGKRFHMAFTRKEGVDPGEDLRGYWIVQRGDEEPRVVFDRNEATALIKELFEEDDDEGR